MTTLDRRSSQQTRRWVDVPVVVAAWVLLAAMALFTVQPLTAQHDDHGAAEQAQTHAAEAERQAQERSAGQAHGAGAQQEPGGHGTGGHGVHEPELKSLLQSTDKEIFNHFFVHLLPHADPIFAPNADPKNPTTFFDVNRFQIYALLLMFVVFLPVLASFGVARPNVVLRVFRGWCHWIRDEIVYATMGKEEGRAWTPFFLYLFFFIAFANLLGLLPHSKTSTASIYVTAALAIITFVVMIGGGMIRQGPFAFWKNLVPHGIPVALVPLLAVLELIGLIVKPFALMVRLFANMLAGHLVLYSFLGLIFLFAKLVEKSALSYPLALPGYGLAVFIFIIESFVALLQAYIFTLLSCIFIQQSLHPEH
jgi:F-type H+-transporting ATPase subunit a